MKLQAKKSLGQHFLNSPHVLSQIIEAGELQKGEEVLEIGPGTGILTRGVAR
jgi:16S rRNA (adenine1518-N6/adenine1519-N6)-dimethyltransferase